MSSSSLFISPKPTQEERDALYPFVREIAKKHDITSLQSENYSNAVQEFMNLFRNENRQKMMKIFYGYVRDELVLDEAVEDVIEKKSLGKMLV